MSNFRMMAFGAPVAVMALLLPLSQAANALSITNRDASEMKMTVVEQEGQPGLEFSIEAQQTLDNICAKGCVITLNNGETDTFEGEESVIIQNGQFTISE